MRLNPERQSVLRRTAVCAVAAISLGGVAIAQCPPMVEPGRGFTGFRSPGGCSSPGSALLAPCMWDRDGEGPLPPQLVVACPSTSPIANDPNPMLIAWDGHSWSRAASGSLSFITSGSDTLDAVVYDGRLVVLCWRVSTPDGLFSNLATLENGVWSAMPPGPTYLNRATRLQSAANSLFVISDSSVMELDLVEARILRWDGSTWSTFANTLWLNSRSISTLIEWQGQIFVGGSQRSSSVNSRASLTVTDEKGTRVVGGGMNGGVNAMAIHDDRLIVGGEFTEAGGIPTNRLAAWDGESWTDLGFPLTTPFDVVSMSTVGGGLLVITRAASDYVVWEYRDDVWHEDLRVPDSYASSSAEIVDVDGEAVMFRGPYRIGGASTPHVATRRDGIWRPLEDGTDTSISRILDVAGERYAVGRFRLIEGVLAGCVARQSGHTWEPLPRLVDSDVLGDALIDAADYRGDLVVAGQYTSPADPSLSYVARWDGESWVPVGPGFWSAPIHSLYADGDSLWAGGAQGIGVLNPTGTWTDVAQPFTTVSPMPFQHLTRHGDSMIVAGRFTLIGGVPAQNIASWSGAGWEALGSGLSGMIYAVASFQNRLIVGGFFSIPGYAERNLAEWDGASWKPFLGGADSLVEGLVPMGDRLLISGAFDHIGAASYPHGALYNGSTLRPFAGQSEGSCGFITDGIADGRNAVVVGGFATLSGLPSSFIGRLTLPCPNDYTCDGLADINDLVGFLDDFSACSQQPSPCGAYGNADITSDGNVDILDLLEFLDTLADPCE